MFPLATAYSAPVLASTSSYFAAHVFAALAEAELIPPHRPADHARVTARSPDILRKFAAMQEPSAIQFFIDNDAKPGDPYPALSIHALGDSPPATLLLDEQVETLQRRIVQGARDLPGTPDSWVNVAVLESRYIEISASEPYELDAYEAFKNLAILFGKSGMKRRARYMLQDDAQIMSYFRASAPDSGLARLNRIEKLAEIGVAMTEACLEDGAERYFLQAVHLAKDVAEAEIGGVVKRILEQLKRSELSGPALKQVKTELSAVTQRISDTKEQTNLQEAIKALI